MDELLAYLAELRKLKESGIYANTEINRTLQRIEEQLNGHDSFDKAFWLMNEAKEHPLIESNYKKDWPKIQGTDVYVRDVLHELSAGLTVHQICEKHDLDINQVQSAIIYAAHLVTFPIETRLEVKAGGHIDISYVDGCKNHPETTCQCNVRGGKVHLDGPITVKVPGKI